MSADGLVRCVDCRHAADLNGSWCGVVRNHAGGRYLRRCAHYAPPTPAPGLEAVRALPGVAEAELREGRLWLRFDRHATTEQRDYVAELLTGRRPRLRRFELPQAERDRKRTQQRQAPRHGGNAA